MHALTPDDLLPLDEYAGRRREFFEAQCRYLDRYRRVRVGPRAALLFENRQTLWFRVQEVLRIARVTEAGLVRRELDLYNRLLPGPNGLQAALLIEVADERRLLEELALWQTLRGEQVSLVLGATRCPGELVTCRPEDRCVGTAHWVRFPLDPPARVLLGDVRQSAHFEIRLEGYQHASPPLSDDIRQSLLEDLHLSDRSG
ncbi:MAG: DUF3501 family protein [Planctomycetes bacterium]|nr:DUF3501 family protein [Planctomycetota bacterium]